MRAVEVVKVVFGYRREPLFDGLDIDIETGEFLSVIGPNGAGKSTLLRLIAGLLEPQAGQVLVLGEDIRSLGPRRIAQLVGVVLEDGALAFNYPVHEVVMMGRTPYLAAFQRPGRADHEAVEKAIEMCDIGALCDRGIAEISAGERQRVILARALAQEPQLLLLDEAFSHLDMTHQHSALRILRELNRAGKTVVFLSHDLNLAALAGTRVLLLQNGRVAAHGSTAEVLTPRNMRMAYGIEPVVLVHPQTGTPQVLLPGS
ncbi:MAG: ABC transporter ATP-binding protein [candidate division WOR-3 bacterium]